MKLSMKNFPIMIILIASGIYACANETIPKRSGFLSDYSKLSKTPYKDAEGAYSYVNPQKSLNLYSNFIVLPVQIRLVQGAIASKVPQEDMQKLADFFYHKLIMELKNSDYHVVQEPGPNTLILRVAITNLEPTNPIVSWSRNPSPKFGGIWGGASAEAELIDALTGEVVVAVIDTQKGKKYDKITRYGNTLEVIERWARRLIIRMDKAHNKTQ